ncbi:unnamed protein product [Linum trigynum]|uniref:Uncharacterized protein n=1 Tax=Linum trigynum TaxID=586398 RepID=A0AAV2GMV3_9ROSI
MPPALTFLLHRLFKYASSSQQRRKQLWRYHLHPRATDNWQQLGKTAMPVDGSSPSGQSRSNSSKKLHFSEPQIWSRKAIATISLSRSIAMANRPLFCFASEKKE